MELFRGSGTYPPASRGPSGWRTNALRLAVAVFLSLALSCTITPLPKTEPDVPYLPTPPAAVTEMLRLAGVTGDDTVYDLGSGDGRIVITAARDFHARAVGVEIDPALVAASRANAREAGVSDRATFLQGDILKADLRDATVVTLYLLPGLNGLLIPNLLAELSPGARIVSHMHDMGDWRPDRTLCVGDSTIYLWVVPARVYGTWEVAIDGPESPGHATLSLRQSFQEVGGSLSLGGRRMALFDTTLRGGRLNFSVKSGRRGAPEVSRYSGTVAGDAVKGEVAVEDKTGHHGPIYTWTARRLK